MVSNLLSRVRSNKAFLITNIALILALVIIAFLRLGGGDNDSVNHHKNNIPSNHRNIIEAKDWHIKKIVSKEKIHPTAEWDDLEYETYKLAGVDLKPYMNQFINLTSYEMKETLNGETIIAYIYYNAKKTIGVTLWLTNHDPGITRFEKKSLYMKHHKP